MRRGRRIVQGNFAILVAGYPLLALFFSIVQFPMAPASGWLAGLGVALSCLAAAQAAQMARARMAPDRSYRRRQWWLSFLVLLGLVVCFQSTSASAVFVGLWWAFAFLVARRSDLVLVTSGIVGGAAGAAVLFPPEDWVAAVLLAGYVLFMAAMFTAANLSLLFVWDIAREAHAAQDSQARLAVTEERLRFARDMHDLLGHSLSGIAVRSELAARLAQRGSDDAAIEMMGVQTLARRALREVRSAVTGYRRVDLVTEITDVRAVLTAAGITCTVTGPVAEIPSRVEPQTAWVVREGGTNVLRHSRATRCQIAVRSAPGSVIVEMYNDGAPREPDHGFGNGLSGLTERLATTGGALSAQAEGNGGFLLRAVLPVASESPAGGLPAAAEPRENTA